MDSQLLFFRKFLNFSLNFSRTVLLAIEISIDSVFYQLFKYVILLPSWFLCLGAQLVVNLIEDPLYMSCISLAALNIFSLLLALTVDIVSMWISLSLMYLKFVKLLKHVDSYLSLNLRSFRPLFLWMLFLFAFLLLLGFP